MELAIADHDERFARAVAVELRRVARQAYARFLRHQETLTAAGEIRVPNPQELADAAAAEKNIAGLIVKYRVKASNQTINAMSADMGISFDVRNELLDGVLAAQSGTKISTAPAELVTDMMGSLQESYDTGASIPKAARAMRKVGYEHSKFYAERVARTELIGAVNSSSLRLVELTGAAKYKVWMATMDRRTRPHHREADGQTVSVKDSFLVGGSRLSYPGDPNGPADEVILCRCALGYSDSANLDLIAGGAMATVAEEETTVGAAWSGPIVQEGVDTGDGRRIAEGALSWRELPLTLMAQHSTPGMGGHADAQVAGRIDTLARNGANIDGSGAFDTGEWGAETERLVRDGMLKGISVDLAVEEYEIIPAEGVEDPDEAMWLGTLNILKGTILGATIVPFPAFENATVAITASAQRQDLRKVDGVLVASVFMPFAIGDEPEDEGSASEIVEDIRGVVAGYPGTSGSVVVTIDGEETTISFPSADEEPDGEAAAEVENAFATLRANLRSRVSS